MGLFKTLLKGAAPLIIASVQPEAMINTALCAGGKHALGKLPNNSLPYLNLALSVAVRYAAGVQETGNWATALAPALQEGAALMGASTALHQSMKLATKDHLRIRNKSL